MGSGPARGNRWLGRGPGACGCIVAWRSCAFIAFFKSEVLGTCTEGISENFGFDTPTTEERQGTLTDPLTFAR